MAKIQFRAKAEPFQYVDEPEPRYMRVKVPTLTRKHCDMPAFRQHPRYGGFANSDLFLGILAKIKREQIGEWINLSDPPPNVVIEHGFLVSVSIDV